MFDLDGCIALLMILESARKTSNIRSNYIQASSLLITSIEQLWELWKH